VTARRAELLVAAAGAALGAGITAIDPSGAPGAGGIVLSAVFVGALGLGRRHARAAGLVALAALVALAPSGGLSFLLYPVMVAHTFCAGRWDSPWASVPISLAMTGALLAGVAVGHDAGVPALIIPPAGWGAGFALRGRALVAAQLEERARELDEEREAHAALSVRYERARIASELHDIVAHAISVMVVQASAGQRLAARDPELAGETFQAIAGAARQAEEDMGLLVRLLGDEDAIGPAPDLGLIEELVQRAAGSGLDVTLRLEGEREGFPATTVATANRVVQEGLTNALRYASGAAVRVSLRGDASDLLVQVVNAPATSNAALAGVGTGNGLRGLHERASACGGTLDAGPTGDGGWALEARLPRRAEIGARA
jgi:signal transduction histidine kinase